MKTPTQIKSLARGHTDAAIKTLAGIMNQDECAPAARVAAATALLDRGWGKPAQPNTGEDGEGPVALEITWKKPDSDGK